MYQNKIFDVIIVGASYEGIALCEYLTAKNRALKVALVSSNFSNCKPRQTLDTIMKVEHTVVYSSYVHGLIGFELEDGSKIFGLNAVIATGSKPVKLDFNCPNIYYKTADVKHATKNNQTIVIGDSARAIHAAFWAAKECKYVYLCSPTFDLDGSKEELLRLSSIDNIVHLPNCKVVETKNNRYGNLIEATLSTYDTIRCNSIIAITERLPDVPQLNPLMISLDNDGYLEVNHLGEIAKVPKLFALGACTRHNSKRNITVVGRRIISLNNWKQED